MPARRRYLVWLAALLLTSQSCAAYKATSDNTAAAGAQDTGSEQSGSRRAAFASSRFSPRDLLLSIDFERAEVQPVRGREDKHARLRVDRSAAGGSVLGIFYEGGSERDRYARISAAPDGGDRVLHYWLKNARAEGQKSGRYKGRIQLNLSELQLDSVFQRYRLYLHPDLEAYRRLPRSNGWFTINELWMGARWRGHPFPFRLGIGIAKPEGVGKPLYFLAAGEVSAGGAIRKGKWKTIWSQVAGNFEIPLGEWLDIEMGYRQGDRSSGRFYMAVKPASESRFTTLFDIKNWTYHPDSPQPVALSDWQPLKLYTSSRVIDFVRRGGGVTQLYFDDLEIYRDW